MSISYIIAVAIDTLVRLCLNVEMLVSAHVTVYMNPINKDYLERKSMAELTVRYNNALMKTAAY